MHPLRLGDWLRAEPDGLAVLPLLHRQLPRLRQSDLLPRVQPVRQLLRGRGTVWHLHSLQSRFLRQLRQPHLLLALLGWLLPQCGQPVLRDMHYRELPHLRQSHSVHAL